MPLCGVGTTRTGGGSKSGGPCSRPAAPHAVPTLWRGGATAPASVAIAFRARFESGMRQTCGVQADSRGEHSPPVIHHARARVWDCAHTESISTYSAASAARRLAISDMACL